MSILQIKLFGEFSLVYADESITKLKANRLQSLVSYLLLHHQAPQPRQHLAFQLWPETTEKQARANLRNLVFQLRKAFPPIEEYIHLERKTIQWNMAAPYTLDVADFTLHLQSESAEGEACGVVSPDALQRAIDLYTGDLIPDLYDEWIVPFREKYRTQYTDALQKLSAALEAQRQYEQALLVTEKLLQTDPLHESSYRQMMRLHAFNNDSGAALEVYQTCEAILNNELGVEPNSKTVALKENLLTTLVGRDSRATIGVELAQPIVEPSSLFFEDISHTQENTFIGRHQEWQLLKEAWQQTEAGRSHCVIISGEAGIGKTRLAEELVSWVQKQGHSATMSHCYIAQQSTPYSPIIKWLRSSELQSAFLEVEDVWQMEVSRLVPELTQDRTILETASPVYESWQRRHLFDALIQIVGAANGPLLFVVDDMQWSDVDSLEWLLSLMRENQEAMPTGQPPIPVLLLCTLRAEESDNTSFIKSWTNDLNRRGLLTTVKPEPLSSDETVALGSSVAQKTLSEEDGTRLYGQTEGHPLYIVETVRAGLIYGRHSGPSNKTANNDDAHSATAMMESIIEARLNQLSNATRSVINLAAVVGREFGYEILVETSSIDEETLVDALDEALEWGIIREQGQDSYDFCHGKIRQALYDTLSNARRRLYHKQLGMGLEKISSGRLDAVAGQLAHHYELGGVQDKAIFFYLHAAKVAQDVYANHEALRHYQHLLSSELASHISTQTRCEILATAGHVWFVIGQRLDATSHYNELLTLATAKGSERFQAIAHHGLARVEQRQG